MNIREQAWTKEQGYGNNRKTKGRILKADRARKGKFNRRNVTRINRKMGQQA